MTGLYICYWSLLDPLCQTQVLAYLRQLTRRGHRFALLTFEQQAYATTKAERAALKRQLREEGIDWHPLTYHKRLPLVATAYDCLQGALCGVLLAWRYRPQVVHSRSSIAAAMAMAVAALARTKFLYDADARLSQEYLDNGHWLPDSRAYRVTSWVEATARRRADAVVVLSERLRGDFITEFGVNAPIEVIPCCVDTAAFGFDEAKRAAVRQELRLSANERLFIYVGKSGARYLVDEMFGFFRAVGERLSAARLLIVSGEAAETFHRAAARQQVRGDRYEVRRASREQVADYLTAADAGLALIRSAVCERGSSPIKIGEYLAAGLPVVMTDGIGDYSDWVRSNDLGVIVAGFDQEAAQAALDRLTEIWQAPEAFRRRARQFAEAQLSLADIGGARYHRVYEQLLKPSR